MTGKRLISVWGLLLLLALHVPAALAEDPAVPDEEPASAEPAAAPEPTEPAEKQKRPFGLFVGVAGGVASIDPLNPSLSTNPDNTVFSSLSLDDQTHVRASIGWKLPQGKGAFRLMFQGTKEEEYAFTASGRSLDIGREESVSPTSCIPSPDAPDTCLVEWWEFSIKDGNGVSTQYTPLWEPTEWAKRQDNTLIFDDETGMCIPIGIVGEGDDRNYPELGIPCNGLPDPIEVRYETDIDGNKIPSRTVESALPTSLQNQVQTYDIVYGREFGGRRYSSRWWGGMRYFEYNGNIIEGAWLNVKVSGEGVTTGTALRFLNVGQESSGFGPTGSWEVDFNFFNKGLELFLRGQTAFMFNSLNMDTGLFFFPVPTGPGANDTAFIAARINDSRNKSSWQNTGEIGARLNFKSGLQIDAGFFITGYLDVVLLPATLSGLDNFVFDPQDVPEAEDALGYNTGTQDIVLDGWYAGISYQF